MNPEYDRFHANVVDAYERLLLEHVTFKSRLMEDWPARPPLPWWRRQLNRLRLPWNLRAFGFQLRFGRERDFEE